MNHLAPSEWLHSIYSETDLVMSFLGTFARLEYAMKATTRYLSGTDKKAEAKWDCLGDDLKGLFPNDAPGLLEAEALFQQSPPKKQVVVDGHLDWVPVNTVGESREKRLLHLVRTVRNNLFHGGKHYTGPVPDPARDRKLLQACIAILEVTVQSQPELDEHFRAAA